jgi:hypothetical protein
MGLETLQGEAALFLIAKQSGVIGLILDFLLGAPYFFSQR